VLDAPVRAPARGLGLELKITSSRFVCAAHRAEDEPAARGADVVLLGRSNVGKSSLINRLLGQKGLARTSSTPGRTQSVNFYRVNEAWNFVDLPGYGWARVPEAVRRAWRPMIEGYLERRARRIALALLVLDVRHPPSEHDRTMREWLDARGIDYVVVATKADKLSASAREGSLALIGREIAGSALDGPILFSAKTGLGLKAVWRWLEQALTGASRSGAQAGEGTT